MRLHKTILIASAFVLAAPAGAVAAEYTVTQKGKKFSPNLLNIVVGDSVKFVNDDKHRHNIYSRTEGHNFSIRKQQQGESNSRTFTEAGTIRVRCAIHPKMRLTINAR